MSKIHKGLFYTVFSTLVIVVGTVLAIMYARGNFRVTRQGYLPEAGLLSANSFPTGAEVTINDRLVTATDDTINLEPGTYTVEISREGYSKWQKELEIEKGLVTQTNAHLFPTAPSLLPLTFSDAQQIIPSPDGLKLLYHTASASSDLRNGLYVLELSDNLLSINREPRQIAYSASGNFDFTDSSYIWSPDSSEVMIIHPRKHVLLKVNQESNIDIVADISFQEKQILSEWEEEMYLRERQFLGEFPEEVIAMATQSAQSVYISPDKKRLLYTYVGPEMVLPDNLVPPLPAINTQPQNRTLQAGGIYIYDREEDTNFQIDSDPFYELGSTKKLLATDLSNRRPITLEASPSAFTVLQASNSAQTTTNFLNYHTPVYAPINYQWFTNSKHLLYTSAEGIRIKEYDNTNDTLLYGGPFENNFVYPWPDGSKLVVATTFRPDGLPNLYAIEIKR